MTVKRKAPAARSQTFEAEAAAPEADRLEPFPHPRFTPELFGHDNAEAALLDGFNASRMHHAWLLTGPEGIGKATLAWRFARFALSQHKQSPTADSLNVDFATPAIRQVQALSHLGLFTLRRTWNDKTKKHGTTIAVEDVRGLKDFLGRTTEDGQWRTVIIDRGEELNPSAANAVLKTLEEPPKRTLFLIVSSEPGRLLPTILSRCRRLDLAPLGARDLAKAVAGPLAAAGLTERAPEDTALYAGLAGGSVGRALTLSATGGLELYERLNKLLARAPVIDLETAHRLADELSPAAASARFSLAMSLLRDLLGRLVRHLARGRGALPGETDLFRRLGGDGGMAAAARWSELWAAMETARLETLALNLDKRSFLLLQFQAIAAAARG